MRQIEHLLRSHGVASETDAVHLVKLHAGTGMRNPKVSFVFLRNGAPSLFLKTVRFPADASVVMHAHECLRRMNALLRGTPLADAVPQAVWVDTCAGVPVSAESLMGGRPLRAVDAGERTTALGWIEAYAKNAVRRDAHLNVSETFSGHVAGLRSNNAELLSEINGAFRQLLAAAGGDALPLPAVSAHGDMTPSNMLMDAGGVRVIDWDRAGDITVPLFDVLTFCERCTPKGESIYAVHREELVRHAAAIGVATQALPLLCYWYLILTDWRKRDRHFSWELPLWDKDLLTILRRELPLIRAAFSA